MLTGRCRCTDVGKRTVSAIRINRGRSRAHVTKGEISLLVFADDREVPKWCLTSLTTISATYLNSAKYCRTMSSILCKRQVLLSITTS